MRSPVAGHGRPTCATPISSSTRRPSATRCLSSSARIRQLIDLPYPETATAHAARAAGARVVTGLEVLVAQGAASFELDGPAAPIDVMHRAVRSRVSTLGFRTAGESHGPALVAVVTGLPAGLVLDREAINDDLRRRQQGYGRSPRQQIETDEVEVLAGLRHGRTLGTPLALVVGNRDHVNWTGA